MKKNIIPVIVAIGVLTATGTILLYERNGDGKSSLFFNEMRSDKEERELFVEERWKYEFNMLKDPGTGKIPYGIRDRELAFARIAPEKEYDRGFGVLNGTNLNTYTPAGPTNFGGRTRGLAYDKRFGTGGNQVIIAGCVSGGIMRSADGGNTWTRVNPDNDIHNLSALVQDPRPGSEDTWYAGGGEPIANSAEAAGAPYLGLGVWKSVNNGLTWTKLTLQVTDIGGAILGAGTLENFDNPFDFVHQIKVNPANGHVYVGGHRRLIRSTDGGNSWNVVFTGTIPTTSDNGQMDIACTNSGKIYLAVNGAMPDKSKRGVWTSVTGDANSWTRIAGGNTLGVDSVDQWRGNSYEISNINTDATPPDTSFASRRILLALVPSNQNIVYVCYENGLSQDGTDPKPEVDMYKLDVSGGGNVWTNLSANMPDFPGQLDGVDPLDTQNGYNMTLAIKPDDANVVFVGGSNLFRSTSGFTNTTATAWIGGYNQDFTSGLKIDSTTHPDFHNIVFEPSNFNHAICANDGGLQITLDIMAVAPIRPVTWSMIRNYQTLQYYHVALDPQTGQNNFIGAAQDNGTSVRLSPGNDHSKIFSGDGGAAAIASFTQSAFTFYGSSQYGRIHRDITNNFNEITPSGLTTVPGFPDGFGEFVTYFKLDAENPQNLYYVNFNRLFRTTNASTVTSAGWTELTGVRIAINPTNPANGTNIGIRALELSHGPYFPSHALFIGTTNGKVFRLDDPKNATAGTAPVDITPPALESLRTQSRAVTISDIASNPNNDQELMVTVSNYSVTLANNTTKTDFNIWWTNNAKSASPTWKLVEGNLSLPSIRSCQIVVKKDASNNSVTEYYVGTSVGLYSALNIGTAGTITWVREGGSVLNYAVVNSLDYRPQDNILLLGTHGNGMFFANTGTPDYRPNLNTGVNDPVRNDKNFIRQAFPSIVKDKIDYLVGNMTQIRKITIQIYNVTGQLVQRKQTTYADGETDVKKLPNGTYILQITSDDNKQQFLQKFVKD